jgi:hypothetical protein
MKMKVITIQNICDYVSENISLNRYSSIFSVVYTEKNTLNYFTPYYVEMYLFGEYRVCMDYFLSICERYNTYDNPIGEAFYELQRRDAY